MKTSILPTLCSIALVAMSASGMSHWWSLRHFVMAWENAENTPRSQEAVVVQPTPNLPEAQPTANTAPPAELAAAETPATAPALDSHQKEFFQALISRMENLQNQNRDLLDQLAETNRDLMKLQFQVDTHSESFRPMPVTEDRPFTSLEKEIGVLPPRAEPVPLPYQE